MRLIVARPLERRDVARRHVPEQQPLARGLHEVAPALGGRRDAAAGELALGAQREQVLLLRRHELGRVQRGERLALAHLLADEVDEELLDVSLVLGVDVVDLALVHRDAADGADGALELPAGDGLAAHAEQLPSLGRERHHRAAGDDRPVHLVLVDGHVVHPHLVLARHGGVDGRVHRRAVVDDLAPACGGGRTCGGRGAAAPPVAGEASIGTRSILQIGHWPGRSDT